jgi:NADH dehydrogenase/NADH:ubiquinone oxidoreductase subunit G
MLGYAQKGGINDVAAAKPKLLLSLGADEVDYTKFADSMIVYVGHHGDKGAHAADVILPASAFTEKAGISSTPKAACNLPKRLCSLRVMLAKTGRSCAPWLRF